MRRGRAGLGGWRNENPRHFRSRGSGTPHYRPPRNYGMLDGPRQVQFYNKILKIRIAS